MPITTGQMNSFLRDDGTKKLQGLMKAMMTESIYSQFMRVTSTNDIVTTQQAYNNMREAQRIPEGAPYPSLDFQPGWTQKFTQIKFGCLWDITEEVRHFDRFDIVATLSRQGRNSIYKAKEIIGANYLVNADSTTPPVAGGAPLINTVGGDGLALFSTAHTWRGVSGNTWDNITNASYADLTETGLNSIKNAVSAWLDNTQFPLGLSIDRVMIPPELAQKAYKLMKSTNEPSTDNNAVNSIPVLVKGSKEPLENKMIEAAALGDGNTWFAMTDADPESFDLQWFVGWDDKVVTGMDDRNQTNFQGISFMCATGCNELRGLYKSKYV